MIKFFRRIRQNLVSQNKISKYLLYAIGEIVLVVLGILIALSINTWNENRKSNKVAVEVYTNLLTSLEQDSIEVQRTIELLTKSLETQKKLITSGLPDFANELDQSALDRLVQDVFQGVMSFFPKTGVYDLIISNNSMDLLQSERIKPLLINLYDFQYKRYENVDAIVDNKYHYYLGSVIRKKLEYLVEYDSDSKIKIIKSVDRNQFTEHYDELVSECRDVYGVLSTGNNYLIEIKASIQVLTKLIREELHH
jgi:hypothetical protein